MDWNSEKEIFSSDDSSYDSDKIDSDIEADLYSVIHYEQETSLTNSYEFNTSITSQEKVDVGKSHCSENINKTKANNSDKTEQVLIVNLSQNSKNSVEVQTIEFQKETDNGKLNKRKSSVISDLLSDIQSETKKRKKRTKRKKNISECNEILSDDSDIICLGPKEKELQTNISNLTISLDCSSDSNDSWYDKVSNKSSISFSSKKFEDLWSINNEDLYRNRRRSNRYHQSELPICSNCNEQGHVAKDCSVPAAIKCYICGNRHNPINCKRRTCANCFRVGHDSRFCKSPIITCKLCNMTGHPSEDCPDLWRRYHLTTSDKGIQASRTIWEEPIFCYNCGFSGHFGGNCIERRMNTTSFPTWPSVINYEKPHSTFKPSKNTLNESNINFEEDEARKKKAKNKNRRERKMQKYLKITLQTQQNDFPRTLKTEIAIQNSKKKALQAQQNDSPHTALANQNSSNETLKTQQNTPTTEKADKNSLGIISKYLKLPDFSSKQNKQFEKEIVKQKKQIKKLRSLRQQILGSNKVEFPLLDLSGQKDLPYSYKSLRNRAKKERRQLRKLMAETHFSNNTSTPLIDKS